MGGSGVRTVIVVAELKHQLVECFRVLGESESTAGYSRRETEVRQRRRYNVECGMVVIVSI